MMPQETRATILEVHHFFSGIPRIWELFQDLYTSRTDLEKRKKIAAGDDKFLTMV